MAEAVPELEPSTLEEVPDGVIEVPVSRLETTPNDAPHNAAPPDAQAIDVKPKAKARGQRGKDKQTRAKPKPKPKAKAPTMRQSSLSKNQSMMIEEESESSADEATLHEIHSLNLIRSIRAYDNSKHIRKQQLYASWFGR